VSALYDLGVRVAAMKPVESGGTSDSQQLRHAAGDVFPAELVTPVSLPDPVAPLLAARRAHRTIELDVLDRAFTTLHEASDMIVVEGAGGLLVPLTPTVHIGDLFRRWELELIIVAVNRLGAVNHTLLTIDAARALGLRVRAVVLNTVVRDAPSADDPIALDTNQSLIAELRDVPVYRFPHLDGATRTADHRAAGRDLVEWLRAQ